MFHCIKNGLRNIFRKKMRSGLTVSGVAIGVASVLLIATIGEIGKQTVNQELESMGIGGLTIGTDHSVTTKNLDLAALNYLEDRQTVRETMPMLFEYTVANIRNQSSNCLVWGINNRAEHVISLQVQHGRLINRTDLTTSANVCVVEESFAKQYYGRGNIVGKNISVVIGDSQEQMEIIGVAETGGNLLQGLMGEYVPTFIYFPYTTLQRMTGKDHFDQIAVTLQKDVDPDSEAKELVIGLQHLLEIKKGVHIENLNQHRDQLNSILAVVTTILSVIGGISLVVSGLSIMTVMLVSVHERTREIGIKKSIGAGKPAILVEFLSESLFLSLIGSLIGIAIGLAVVIVGSLLLGLPIFINPALVLFCIGFAVLIGAVFGAYPAWKAAGMRPVDALRQLS